ncbi:DUF4097 family beta strand repeat-containing protein [Actinomadura kijaniata]|uniref:DUF4097 family beta strand repeat-containing protein n=1 Tax=Actinomadura kijaniata TaxID=46161 RepID=UPI0008333C95|nr:DUF4097 family beta strand repeat-containing protein [Actinomadura kijaniata]
MSRWTIDEPTTLAFDGAVALKVTLITGSVNVLAGGDTPSIEVSEVEGPPLTVAHEAGMLTVTHEKLWEGVLNWLRTQRVRAVVTVTVPRDCPVTLNLVSADAVVTGLAARTSIKTGAGDVTLDGVTGAVDVNTVAGAVEAQGVDGTVSFTSVSGDLALAGGVVERLSARSGSGRIAADVALARGGSVEVNTVAGEITLRVPDGTGATVHLNAAAGRIETSFPGLDRQDRPVGSTVTGTVGDGSGRVAVSSVAGGVTLLGRPADDPDGPAGITTPEMEK